MDGTLLGYRRRWRRCRRPRESARSPPSCPWRDLSQNSFPCSRVRSPILPGCRFQVCVSALFLLRGVSLISKAKVKRCGTGILILPIHCLFLSLPTISCRSIPDSALFLIHEGAGRDTRGKSEDYKQGAVSTRS